MAIPEMTNGRLPPGVHRCTLPELKARFGSFRGSDKRQQLFDSFCKLLDEVRRTDLFVAVVVDGSFVTDVVSPNDIDLILVLRRDHDWNRDSSVRDYNLLSRRMLRRRFGFDAFLALDGDSGYDELVAFFACVRESPEIRKGMVRLQL